MKTMIRGPDPCLSALAYWIEWANVKILLQCLWLVAMLANLGSTQADDQSTRKSISQYFKNDKLLISRHAFYNTDHTQRVESYCEDENRPGGANEGASNPANVHCAAALFLKESGIWAFSDAIQLRYGTVKRFTNYKLVVVKLEYGDNDALCCPSRETTLIFNTSSGKLIEDLAAEGKSPLIQAVEEEADAKKVADLIAQGANGNARDAHGSSALMLATERGNANLVKLLLDHDADVNAQAKENGKSALILATMSINANIVRQLLDKGADVNAKQIDGRTALIWAAVGSSPASEEIVRLLLDKGANVDAKTSIGQTALSTAASFGRDNLVQLLLERGANASDHGINGRTPLHQAAARNRPEIVKLFLHYGADVNARDTNGRTPLMGAVGWTVMVTLLLEHGADVNAKSSDAQTALIIAAKGDRLDTVKLLLESGADAGAKDSEGRTALMVLAPYLSKTNAVPIAKLLLDRRADINSQAVNGETALLRACSNGSEELVRLLLMRGADVGMKDEKGYTAILRTAFGINVNCNILQMLLDKGADGKDKIPNGKTVLMEAAWRSDNSKCVQSLLDGGADVNARDGLGWTALMYAAFHGKVANVELLLRYGADPSLKANAEQTALDMARKSGLSNARVLELLESRTMR